MIVRTPEKGIVASWVVHRSKLARGVCIKGRKGSGYRNPWFPKLLNEATLAR